MKKTNETIALEFLDEQISMAGAVAKELRRRLSEAQKQTNRADELLLILQRAREVLATGDLPGRHGPAPARREEKRRC